MSENMLRVATVSLNPAIDQTANVPNFTAGGLGNTRSIGGLIGFEYSADVDREGRVFAAT